MRKDIEMAGLPGTGLGGIFYALLIVWMVAREACLLATAPPSRARWMKISPLVGLLGGIALALWLEAWLLQQLLRNLPTFWHPTAIASYALEAVVPALAISPFVVLAVLIATVHVTRLVRATHQK
jgi:hypothetical protein